MEQITSTSLISDDGRGTWSLSKLCRARRMLLKGQSPQQVGSALNLSQSQIEELAMDVSDIDPQPELESHTDWEKRKREELAKKFVGIAETQADYLAEGGAALDPDSMGTLVDASAIAHKWLKAGEEGVKSQTINFSFLAQAKPPAIGTGEIIELETEVQESGD